MGVIWRLQYTVFWPHKAQWLRSHKEGQFKNIPSDISINLSTISHLFCCFLSYSAQKTGAYVPRFFEIYWLKKRVLDGAIAPWYFDKSPSSLQITNTLLKNTWNLTQFSPNVFKEYSFSFLVTRNFTNTLISNHKAILFSP